MCSVDYAVAVPPVARSELSTASGNLTASGLAGTVTLTCGTFGNVLRFLPPLVIGEDLLDEGLSILEDAFASV